MRILLFAVLIIFTGVLNAQEYDIEEIKADTSYYWGLGREFESEEDARRDLSDLYSNIAMDIKSNYRYFGTETPQEYLKKIIATFEDEIYEEINENNQIVLRNGDKYSYFSYIRRHDFRAICDNRINEIQTCASSGLKMERKKTPQMYEALVAYCKGMSLCIAHPMGSTINVKVDREEHDAYSWFEKKINDILKSFKFSVNENAPGGYKNNGIFVNLDVNSSNNVPVVYLKYSYFNGESTMTSRVYEGKAWVHLYDESMTQFDVRVEYSFLDNVAPKTRKFMESINKDTFKSDVRITIDLEPYLEKFSMQDDVTFDETISDKYLDDDYESIIKEVEKGIRSAQYSKIEKFFTPECYNMLDTLTKYGKISVFGQQQYEFIPHGDVVICRGILMKFEFKKQEFYDEIVFRFDTSTNLISSIAFRLNSQAENNIYSKTMWPLDNRLTLISFLEDYQTAYSLKRYDYLESIFSDDALIITGHIVKKMEEPIPDRMTLNLPTEQLKLIKHDKDSYFKNLSYVFNKQEYIHIRFGETDFQRQMSMGDDESYEKKYKDIYGVRLFQEYKSGTYSDEGYLFLMVDLRKEVPVIHVRAWQPDKINISDVMGLKNLR